MIRKTIILFVILATIFTSCNNTRESSQTTNINSFDLDSIISRGKLVAVTDFNSTNYFIYKGEPMGFHYELLKEFSDHLGVDLEIITENHLDHALQLLNSGEADLLSIGLTITSTRKKELQFSEPILETRQVLVQKKPRNWRSMSADEIEKHLIRNQLDLAHQTIYVQKFSAHAERLKALSTEIGDTIDIIEVPYESEELIRSVAEGEIGLIVCDENTAQVNSTYYPDIDISTPVSFPQSIAWAVRKNGSEKLLLELDKWLFKYRQSRSYAFLYAKYFRNSRSSTIVKSDYYSLSTGRISRWDDLLKGASREIGWDWRLLSSLVCQESRFDSSVESWAGAIGLMQIMPETGKNFGIDITASPNENVRAGVLYINWLQSLFESRIEDKNERIKFILAAYNAGHGHILDAMKLTEKNGMDPAKWDDNVAIWLLKKSDPQYYNDTVVKNGYFRGTESVNFVSEVLDRYEHYLNMIPENDTRLGQNSGKVITTE